MRRHRIKVARRARRKRGLGKRIRGAERPRLTVFRSNLHIYAQVVDDLSGRTLASASSLDKGHRTAGGNCEAAKSVGTRLAERAREGGVEQVVFDRNGFRYHGRIRSLADAAREAGLKF